ncbi:GLO2 protein, partial [Acromyrmex heyeri]
MFLQIALRACPTWLENKLTFLYFRAKSASLHGRSHSLSTTVAHSNMKVQILPALQDNYMYLVRAFLVHILFSIVYFLHRQDTHTHTHTHKRKQRDQTIYSLESFHFHLKYFFISSKISKIFNMFDLSGSPCIFIYYSLYIHLPNINFEVYIIYGIYHGLMRFRDTLFTGGCGKFFEGTADQMYKALIEILGSLPEETKVYCGHEYTVNNLKFGLHVEPENVAIQQKLDQVHIQRANNLPTVPSTIKDEKLTNPFMRVHEPSVMKHVQQNDPIQTMSHLRREKDNFKV